MSPSAGFSEIPGFLKAMGAYVKKVIASSDFSRFGAAAQRKFSGRRVFCGKKTGRLILSLEY